MNFRLGFVQFATCAGAAANADLRAVVRAVETSAALLNVPTTGGNRLTFRRCDEGALVEVRLTPFTQYFMRGEQLPFAAFRKRFMRLRRSKEDRVVVTFDTETNAVKSVRVA